MKNILTKIEKLRQWEHIGLITTTGNTDSGGLAEFLLELHNEALHLHGIVRPASESAKEGELLPAAGKGEANTCAGCGTLPIVMQNGIKRCAYCGTPRG